MQLTEFTILGHSIVPDMTPTEALAHATPPGGTPTTAVAAIATAADAYLASIDAAQAAGDLDEDAAVQLKSEFVDHVEDVGSNLRVA